MRRRAMLIATLVFLGAGAQEARAGKFYLGLGVLGSEADTEDIDADGTGAELSFGYFFTPRWALELAVLLSDFGNPLIDGDLVGVSINGRLSPLPHSRVQPYLKLGGGWYFLEEDGFDEGIAGPGLNVGTGLEFFLVPGFSLGGEVTWRFIEYTEEFFDDPYGDPHFRDLLDELDGTTVSAGMTLNFHFR